MVRSRELAFSLTTDRSRCVPPPPGYYIITRHPAKQTFFIYFGTTCSCSAHFSTRHIVAHRPVAPEGAHQSLSRRFRRRRITARMTLEYGPWTSCRSARWDAGHRTGRTCESSVVIFSQACDVPHERSVMGPRKDQEILLPTAG